MATCLPLPSKAQVEYKKIVTDFFWNSKRNKVSYNLIIQNIEDGGLNLADIKTRITTIHLTLIK